MRKMYWSFSQKGGQFWLWGNICNTVWAAQADILACFLTTFQPAKFLSDVLCVTWAINIHKSGERWIEFHTNNIFGPQSWERVAAPGLVFVLGLSPGHVTARHSWQYWNSLKPLRKQDSPTVWRIKQGFMTVEWTISSMSKPVCGSVHISWVYFPHFWGKKWVRSVLVSAVSRLDLIFPHCVQSGW